MSMNDTFELNVESVACDLCGAREHDFLFAARDLKYGLPGEFSLVRCATCGLAFLNPRPAADTLHHYYPETYANYKDNQEKPPLPLTNNPSGLKVKLVNHFWDSRFRRPTNLRDHFMQGLLSPIQILFKLTGRFVLVPTAKNGHNKALEFGCGTGEYLRTLREKGWDAVGVEWNGEVAKSAERHSGCIVYSGTIPGVPLEPESFDYISMWHVLEHVPSPTETIKEMAQLLKNNGKLLVAVPNFGSLERRLFGPNWYALEAPRHLFHFDQKTICNLLNANGIKVNRIWTLSESWGLKSSLVNQKKLQTNLLFATPGLVPILAKLLSLLDSGGNLILFCEKGDG